MERFGEACLPETIIPPPDCAVCHVLTAPAVTGRAVRLQLKVAADAPQRVADRVDLPQPLARPHPQPRAPPALS